MPTPLAALAPPGGVAPAETQSPGATGGAPGSLTGIIASEREFLMQGATMNLLPSVAPVALPLEYTAEFRPLAGETAGFLYQFGASFGDEGFSEAFEVELLVREGQEEFWMPLDQAMASVLEGAYAPGDLAVLSVRLLGSLETEAGIRVIFAITGVEQ